MTATAPPPTVPSYVNWLFKRLLGSPLHRLVSGNTMLLTFTGRKTGNRYVAVVRYIRRADLVICYTDSKWWINLRGGAPVEMLIAGRKLQGVATPVEDRATVAASLSEFLCATPGDAKVLRSAPRRRRPASWRRYPQGGRIHRDDRNPDRVVIRSGWWSTGPCRIYEPIRTTAGSSADRGSAGHCDRPVQCRCARTTLAERPAPLISPRGSPPDA